VVLNEFDDNPTQIPKWVIVFQNTNRIKNRFSLSFYFFLVVRKKMINYFLGSSTQRGSYYIPVASLQCIPFSSSKLEKLSLSKIEENPQFEIEQTEEEIAAQIKERIEKIWKKAKKANYKGFEQYFKNFAFKHQYGGRYFTGQEELKQTITSLLKEWETTENADKNRADVLKSLGYLKFSCYDEKERIILDEIIYEYLKNDCSPYSFSFFLDALEQLSYHWPTMDIKMKQEINRVLDERITTSELTGREFVEIIRGMSGLRLFWNDLNEPSRENLLKQLKNNNMVNKIELEERKVYFTMLIFQLGKIGTPIITTTENSSRSTSVNVEKEFLELATKALKIIEEGDVNLYKQREVNEKTGFFRLSVLLLIKILFSSCR
jgi:hypothetical protein